MCLITLSYVFLNAIAAMHIAGENGNVPSCVADWPHCCEFIGHSCDGLRCTAVLLEPSKSQENSPFHRIVWPGLKARPHDAMKWGILLRF